MTVTYRDFRYVTPFLIQVWMYLSPVIYPVSIVPSEWQWLLALNPMVGIIDAFRAALATDRALERAWYNFKNDRALAVVKEWSAGVRAGKR